MWPASPREWGWGRCLEAEAAQKGMGGVSALSATSVAEDGREEVVCRTLCGGHISMIVAGSAATGEYQREV